jgi:hypothetical protein
MAYIYEADTEECVVLLFEKPPLFDPPEFEAALIRGRTQVVLH